MQPVADDMPDIIGHLREHHHQELSAIVAMVPGGEGAFPFD
jgi:hypothetical protein